MALRRFYIPREMTRAPQPEIVGSDAGHIYRVLRLSTGDEVELFDGTGNGYRAQITTASPKRIRFTIEESFPLRSESPVKITLAQGILKDRKMDEMIRPLTELGIDCWMPFYAARSIPVPGKKKLGQRLVRWEKIALEAVKQCRRGRIPTISPKNQFDDVLDASIAFELKIIFWEERLQAFKIPVITPTAPRNIMVVLGPEGGFDPGEIQQAKAQGFLTAGLGPRILRAQTATLAACTLVQYCFGDMGL